MIISRDLIKYPDQFVTALNDIVRRLAELERRVDKLEKEKN